MKPDSIPPAASDALVDEVRAIRADISARFGNDVNRLCEHLREVEAEYKDRVVEPAKPSSGSRRWGHTRSHSEHGG